MDTEKRALLKKKLEENKLKNENAALEKQKIAIAECVDDFEGKYRFADEKECGRLNKFIGELHFSSPAHIQFDERGSSRHEKMYLCFLCGCEELLKIFLYGDHNDLTRDIESFRALSPYLLLIDEDLVRFIYVDDSGRFREG